MSSTRTDQVTVDDGSFDLHVWLPQAGQGPGILLLQEIFGVSAYIRAVADRLAGLGYVVGAPDVFWRIQRNWEANHDETGLNESLAMITKFDFISGVADCVASLERLRAEPEVHGGTGVMGFCLGGLLTYQVAAATDPDVAISYYGSNIAAGLDLAGSITCPIQFHYGESDPYIPIDQARAVEATFASRDDAEVYIHEGAGHAFDNHEAAMFHNPEAAAAAWGLATGFLARNLPVG
jgi:carboxymethylenebutenolidase